MGWRAAWGGLRRISDALGAPGGAARQIQRSFASFRMTVGDGACPGPLTGVALSAGTAGEELHISPGRNLVTLAYALWFLATRLWRLASQYR